MNKDKPFRANLGNNIEDQNKTSNKKRQLERKS